MKDRMKHKKVKNEKNKDKSPRSRHSPLKETQSLVPDKVSIVISDIMKTADNDKEEKKY